jgi:16S rRNA (cytidine1402-2'-O)-methyltransferase
VTGFLPATGLPTDRFVFEGFLPARAADRRRRLAALAREPRTMIFFESARRLRVALTDLAHAFGARPAAIGRELTKLHEEIVRGDLADLAGRASGLVSKGEVVLAVAGSPAPARANGEEPLERDAGDEPGAPPALDLERAIRDLRATGVSTRDVASRLASEHGLNRRQVYRLAIALERARRP